MNDLIASNIVEIAGEVRSYFAYSHEIFGEKFYMAKIGCKRLSKNYDTILVMVSERLLDVRKGYKGMLMRANGQFRSRNIHDGTRNHVMLFVFAMEIEFYDEKLEGMHTNQIFLDGYICREPIHRNTPLGREIADLLIAVNRSYGKSDYIPCICWGRNARYASGLEIGGHVQVFGRIQSREYLKKLDDGTQESRTSYEVSVRKINVVESEARNGEKEN